MDAQAEETVRSDVLRYVTGATGLREFREQFALHTVAVHSGSALGKLCAEIELLYGEYGDGFLSESELKARLSAIALGGQDAGGGPSLSA